jgi:hypothetical protein
MPENLGNVVILDDFPVFSPYFDEDVAIRIEDVTHGRRLKVNERIQVGQISSIEADVSNPTQCKHKWNSSQQGSNLKRATRLVNPP